MLKILKTIQSFFLTVSHINLFLWTKNYSRNSDSWVIVFPDFPRDFLKYFYSDSFINDMALVNATIRKNGKIKISIGILTKQKPRNKNIFLNISNRYRHSGKDNYSEDLISFIKGLELENHCFPSSSEAKYWENKVYMHQQFKAIGIKEPKTTISNIDDFDLNEIIDMGIPCLIKEVHSAGSLGVHKISSIDRANEIVQKIRKEKQSSYFLIQELLNMDRDLRVILIGDEIVHFYWRINRSKEWKPTSTRHGSDVDFSYFPLKWKDHIIAEFKKLNLTTGAFDLVWINNDYSEPPYILEVSPSYQPNPSPPSELKSSYGEWKSGVNIVDGYSDRFIKLVFLLKKKLLAMY